MGDVEGVEVSQPLEDAGEDVEEVTTYDPHQAWIVPMSIVEVCKCKLSVVSHHPCQVP